MNCREVEKYLYSFLDDEIELRTKIKIKFHLLMCVFCNKRFKFEKAVKSIVKEKYIREEAPPHLRKFVQELIAS